MSKIIRKIGDLAVRSSILIFSIFIIFVILPGGISFDSDDIRIQSHQGNLEMNNNLGGFLVNNVFGNCNVIANAGPIKLGFVSGNTIATTSAGDIEIGEAKGNIKAITRSGNIIIKKAHNHVYAETTFGEVVIHSAESAEVRNISGGDVKLLDISGSSTVVAKGNILLVINNVNHKFPLSKLCNLSSTDGDITVYLPENFGANLEIRTPITKNPWRETRIESNFSFINLKQRYEEGDILKITTQINDGKANINLFIEKGDIYLKAIK